MTSNQIAYNQHLETKRSNLAREAETHRSNVVNEIETQRANRAREGENYRHNTVTEGISLGTLLEGVRSNKARESENVRKNNMDYAINYARNQETERHNRQSESLESQKNSITREGNYLKELGALGPILLGSYTADDYNRAKESFNSTVGDALDNVKDKVTSAAGDVWDTMTSAWGNSTFGKATLQVLTGVTGIETEGKSVYEIAQDLGSPKRLFTDVLPQAAAVGKDVLNSVVDLGSAIKQQRDKYRPINLMKSIYE